MVRQSPEDYFRTRLQTEPYYYPSNDSTVSPTFDIDRAGFWALIIIGTIGLIGILAIAASGK